MKRRAKLKAKQENPALDHVRLEHFEEGLCVQMMHIGPYATEPATVETMRAFAHTQGYEFQNKHHEIYLGAPRRALPEKLKTVLRHPVLTHASKSSSGRPASTPSPRMNMARVPKTRAISPEIRPHPPPQSARS